MASADLTGHGFQPAAQDDDGCAVTMFANGVVLAAFGLVALSALWQFTSLSSRMEMAAYRQTPRYWLPPLCGPPLS